MVHNNSADVEEVVQRISSFALTLAVHCLFILAHLTIGPRDAPYPVVDEETRQTRTTGRREGVIRNHQVGPGVVGVDPDHLADEQLMVMSIALGDTTPREGHR